MSVMPLVAPTDIVRMGPDNTYRWATVTDDDPLRVRLDGDTAELPITPETLVSPTILSVGDRVWVQMFGRRIIVLGVAGGEVDDTGWVDVTPSSGWTPAAGTESPQVRRIGKEVRFKGTLTGTLTATTTTVICVVPVEFRNNKTNNMRVIGNNGGFVGWANVAGATGNYAVHFKTPFATASTVIDLSGMSYLMD